MTIELVGEDDVRRELRARLNASGMTQAAFAESLSVSASFICDVLNGRRPPTGAILAATGFVKMVAYARLMKGSEK